MRFSQKKILTQMISPSNMIKPLSLKEYKSNLKVPLKDKNDILKWLVNKEDDTVEKEMPQFIKVTLPNYQLPAKNKTGLYVFFKYC